MSYILDALRRADAKRANELLPPGGTSATRVVFADTQPYKPALPWPWIAGGCVLLLAGVLAWHFTGSSGNMDKGAASPPTPAPAQPAAAPVALPMPASAGNALPAIADQPPVPAPAPAASKAPPHSPASVTATAPTAVPVPPNSAAPTGSVPAERRIYALEELPADVRAELPKLAITGSAYSDNPAHRMLIANGQILREKDEAAPGLVLEQIRAKAAVLRYKGYRYQLPY